MIELKQRKTDTEQNSHVVYMSSVANASSNPVLIGPFSNPKELEREKQNSGYPLEKMTDFSVFCPFPEGAKKPKANNEPAATAG